MQKNPLPHHAMSHHIMTQNANPTILIVDPKNKCNSCEMSVSQQNITTHHVRHIFTPIEQIFNNLFISHNTLLNVTIQSHPTKDGCYKSNEKCLIVATINPISHSHPVHHGTFFSVSH